MNSMTKEDVNEWALDQMNKYGIRHPDTYPASELKYLNPGIPEDFIDRHCAKRDNT